MDMKGFQQYKEQSINTMTQGELLLLLYDELYKRLAQGELMLDQQNYETYEAALERAVAIIEYLDATLDRQYPISRNLAQLYEYFTYELGRAKIGRRKEVLSHVKTMVGELRDAFRQAQKSGDSGK
ncbi:flagellar export chaperone FliS [uncultured Oscillibacter sp.]|uniref:flagellar export chaperone FliS n=1 Tax=uncultured Oscillibacter sp. TaxID=876091 RepID=UPI0025E12AFB|nr:flagellar export chaperone FliS [uncultured Oscillibacter sp.]